MITLIAAEISGVWIAIVGAMGIVMAAAIAAASPMILARQIEKQGIAKETREVARQKVVAEEAIRQQRAVAEEAKRQQDEVAEEARRRQQEVADQVTETARLSQERQDATDLQLGRVARIAAEAVHLNETKLDAIKVVVDESHVLVNSNMMRELRKSLAGLKAQVVLHDRLADLNEKMGVVTEEDDMEAISLLKAEIADSEEVLVDLIARTRRADKIAEEGKETADAKAAAHKTATEVEATEAELADHGAE